jgi:hypothetical protein
MRRGDFCPAHPPGPSPQSPAPEEKNSHDLAANRLPRLGSELQSNHRGLLR